MTRVLALADQSKIGCITQRRFAKVGTKTHPQRGADLDRNGLSVSTETACRFEPKSPVGNSEICTSRVSAPRRDCSCQRKLQMSPVAQNTDALWHRAGGWGIAEPALAAARAAGECRKMRRRR